ncbi:acyltransferase family protein [Alteromonas flava]|uniref:acyltransferase family protein n=1 Tax=Alteromonas flava TaxID=2048003 RepID=UPI000C288323|nr:acyltransferase [Alteromonas flava]
MPSNRLTELDALRGIAALAVVIYHMVYRYHELYGHQGLPVYWSYFGQYGVQLFFMISGFVIYWTVDRITVPREFVISRFARLYPVYWVAVGLTFAVISLVGLAGREVSLLQALANLSMFHEYFAVVHVDGVYWTLTLELTFYAWILLLLVLRWQQYASLCLLILVCANGLLNLIEITWRPLHLLTLDGYGHFFLLGVLVFDWEQQRNRMLCYMGIGAVLAATVINNNILQIAIYLTLIGLFVLAVRSRLKALRQPVLVWLGAISYSLYLIHQNIGYVLLNQLPIAWHSVLKISIVTLGVIAVAYGLNRWIEVPSNRWCKNRLRARFVTHEKAVASDIAK